MTDVHATDTGAFLEQWDRYRQRADQQITICLDQSSAQGDTRLSQAIRHSTLNGGKRFRAMLVYASGQCFDSAATALDQPAVALELIHAYSLVHDDLPAMDDDDMRRGRASCHKAFDEATAILAGDALQSLAFEQLATPLADVPAERQLRMIRQLAQASGSIGMAGGQSLDIIATGRKLDRPALQDIHERKTGALIRAALQLGALTAPSADETQLAAIDEFGRLVGLAFQVMDDILDQTQTSEQLGKQSGADQSMEKNTYPALMGLTAAQQYADQLVHSAQQSLVRIEGNTDFLHQLAEFTRRRDH